MHPPPLPDHHHQLVEDQVESLEDKRDERGPQQDGHQERANAAVQETSPQEQPEEEDFDDQDDEEDKATEKILDVQIRAIMAQHAEDSKRMRPADAARLAQEALRNVEQRREQLYRERYERLAERRQKRRFTQDRLPVGGSAG
jgi:hypothetical protein